MEILIKLSKYVLAMRYHKLAQRFPKKEFYIMSKFQNEENVLLVGRLSLPKAKAKEHEAQEQEVQEQELLIRVGLSHIEINEEVSAGVLVSQLGQMRRRKGKEE